MYYQIRKKKQLRRNEIALSNSQNVIETLIGAEQIKGAISLTSVGAQEDELEEEKHKHVLLTHPAQSNI